VLQGEAIWRVHRAHEAAEVFEAVLAFKVLFSECRDHVADPNTVHLAQESILAMETFHFELSAQNDTELSAPPHIHKIELISLAFFRMAGQHILLNACWVGHPYPLWKHETAHLKQHNKSKN
jgi:hypothetical protein